MGGSRPGWPAVSHGLLQLPGRLGLFWMQPVTGALGSSHRALPSTWHRIQRCAHLLLHPTL